MTDNENITQQSSPEAILSEIFNVQVPATVPGMIKRRLFTLAARDNHDKVIGHPEVVALLEQVGAAVPELTKDGKMKCFGVLWANGNAVCRVCGSWHTCQALSANYGLTSIKISPRLLGIRVNRIPMILPELKENTDKEPSDDSKISFMVCPTSERDNEILDWLNTYLIPVQRHGDICYKIKNSAHYPISIGKPNGLMEVRFVSPTTDLQRLLVYKPSEAQGKGKWILSEDTSFDQATDLINAHIAPLLENQ